MYPLPPLPLPRCKLSPRGSPMTTMSVVEFMHNHHVQGKGYCRKTNRIFLYFFTCHHCLNILIYTFKCTDKSSSICMTARDDNDEGLSSTTIRSAFDKVSKSMSLYEYVYVGAVHKSFQKGHTSGQTQSQF